MLMGLAQAARRPIEGAVATAGVSDRVAFLRKTYAHLGIALGLWAVLTAGIFNYAPGFSLAFSRFALGSGFSWLFVMLAFMGVKMLARRLALSDTSSRLQYAGLFLSPLAEAIILQPMIWLVFLKFAHSTNTSPGAIIGQAAVITLVIFTGLTATVFITKKDFSFLRGILNVGFWALLGIGLCSMLFGYQIGILYSAAVIALMAGYILYQTSLVMAYFPPTHYVAAALMLYSSIATLFWYVLQILASRRN
jgi:FtsH-binding integral membrane protein